MSDRPIIGILTVSDRASSGEYEDLSGPAIEEVLREYIATDCEYRRVVVSEGFATAFWPDAPSAVGRRIGFQPGQWWEIVGVMGAVHDISRAPPRPCVHTTTSSPRGR